MKLAGFIFFLLLFETAFCQSYFQPAETNDFHRMIRIRKYTNLYLSPGIFSSTGVMKNYFSPGPAISFAYAYKSPVSTTTFFGLISGIDFSYNKVKKVSNPITQNDSLSSVDSKVMLLVINAGGMLSQNIGQRLRAEIDGRAGFNFSFGNNALLYQSSDAKGTKMTLSFQVSAAFTLHYIYKPNASSLFLKTNYVSIFESSSQFWGVFGGISFIM